MTINRKKRMISTALLLAVLASAAVSCGDAGTKGVATETTANAALDVVTEAETDAVTEDPALMDNLPQTDMGGAPFRMTIFGDEERRSQTYYDTEDGNIVNDAVYNKIRTVEDRFNVDIQLTDVSLLAEDDISLLQKSIIAGDDCCELAQGHDISMANAALEGLFVNVYDIPHLDFSKPWWPAATTESMTVADQMYMMFNNISYNNLASTRVMYFNKSLMNELDIAYPYQMVYDGTWTMDAMQKMSASAYKDINGNGQQDDDDRYGYISMPYFYAVMEPFCVEPYRKDKNGKLYYEVDLDRTQRVTDALYELIFGEGGRMFSKNNPDYEDLVHHVFSEGRAMFYYGLLSRAVTHFSDSDVIYGVLPMPKLDETQDQYYGGSTDRPIVVPTTASDDLDNIGIVIEALNAEGYKQVYPAYYEVAMKTRYADQTDDAKMIDIVHDNVIIAFTYLYGDFRSVYNIMLENLFTVKPSTDVASWCAKNEKLQTKRVEKLMGFFEEHRP